MACEWRSRPRSIAQRIFGASIRDIVADSDLDDGVPDGRPRRRHQPADQSDAPAARGHARASGDHGRNPDRNEPNIEFPVRADVHAGPALHVPAIGVAVNQRGYLDRKRERHTPARDQHAASAVRPPCRQDRQRRGADGARGHRRGRHRRHRIRRRPHARAGSHRVGGVCGHRAGLLLHVSPDARQHRSGARTC